MADSPTYPGAPRWLKMSAAAVLVLVLLLAAIGHIVLGGRGLHGLHEGHAPTLDSHPPHTDGHR
jgi:hypothetical protein